MSKHIAVIPARKGSVGFKFKNRKFFSLTADFLDNSKLYDEVVVSTNDEVIKEYASERGYTVHHRGEVLSEGDVSIKAVFDNLQEEFKFKPDDVLWLFYLPILYKNKADFEAAQRVFNDKKLDSLMTFVTSNTHPYTCWKMVNDRPVQFIVNDVFRRQDMPPAWSHYHYVSGTRVSYLKSVNQELLGQNTFPILLDDLVKNKLVEIDTPEDLEKWNRLQT